MDEAEQATPSPTRNLFVSYAREDRDLVDRLRRGLQRMHHEVWVDDRLSVGQTWWSEILLHIRACDAMVVAISPALLESQASSLERAYARDLGKVLLPVCVREVIPELLPPDLAPLQMVDYSTPSSDAAFELAYAMAGLPPSAALPDPLPVPPPVPVSYLSDLAARVHAPSLTLDEQLALVSRLRGALSRPAERAAALELLRSLQKREDLYQASARELDAVIAALGRSTAAASASPPAQGSSSSSRPPPPPPPGPGHSPANAASSVPKPEAPASRPAQSWQQPVPAVARPHQQNPHQPSPQQQRPPQQPATPAALRLPATRPPNPYAALAITSMVASIMTILITFGLAFPLAVGTASLFYSRRTERQVRTGDLDGARRASRTALITGSIGVGGSALVLLVFVVLALGQSY